MKPKAPPESQETGLLEYLEDIIGSNKYVERIEEIEKNLDGKQENKIQRTNLLNACRVELQSLEPSYLEAVEYVKKERNFLKHCNMFHFIELNDGVKNVNKYVN